MDRSYLICKPNPPTGTNVYRVLLCDTIHQTLERNLFSYMDELSYKDVYI